MRRLDEIVAGLLPGLRAMVVEEESAGSRKAPGKVARAVGGGEAPALARTRAHRSTPKTTAAYAETAMASAERE